MKFVPEVRNPLVFFAYSLTLIEGIIVTVALRSDLSADHKFYSIIIAALLFLVVVAAVTAITVWRPKHLYEDVNQIKEIIDSGFEDRVVDVIHSCVKQDVITKLRE